MPKNEKPTEIPFKLCILMKNNVLNICLTIEEITNTHWKNMVFDAYEKYILYSLWKYDSFLLSV